MLVDCTQSPIHFGKLQQWFFNSYSFEKPKFKLIFKHFDRTSVMLTVVSIVVGACTVSIVTMWIYDMQLQAGEKMFASPAFSEVWFLTFVYELTIRGILSNMWAALVYTLVFLSGFLSLVSNRKPFLKWFFFLNIALFFILGAEVKLVKVFENCCKRFSTVNHKNNYVKLDSRIIDV